MKLTRAFAPQSRSIGSPEASAEIGAYIALRDIALSEAERASTEQNLHRLDLANDFVASCLKQARSPYEAQFLPQPDAARERKRCEAVKSRIAQLRANLAHAA